MIISFFVTMIISFFVIVKFLNMIYNIVVLMR